MESGIHRFRVAKTTTTKSFDSVIITRHLSTEINARACDRCRRLRKRCSKIPPECELCISGGHSCSLGQLADRPVVHSTLPKTASDAGLEATGSASLQSYRGAQRTKSHNVETQLQNTATTSTFDGTYLSYAHAYFSHVHRAYPFLEKQKILSNAKSSAFSNLWADNPDSTILGLVLSIGSTTLERAGKLGAYDRPKLVVPYARILSSCLLCPSIRGLQILTLLSLYSLFDPTGISTWSIVGILTRQAITLGLSRSNSFLEPLSSQEEEQRHRLFWSIFVLDRMLAVSIGHPVGLVDENTDVPQPAVTVEEFASSERIEHASLLQLNRLIIRLRQLEQQILSSIHIRNQVDICNMTNTDRSAVLRQLRSAIDDWYSLGCLVCLPEADNIPIHSTITWLNARYYNLLILLYYPCQFNSQSKLTPTPELVSYIQKYLRYNYILLENKQLPLNYITLNRLVPVCLVLLHCFSVMQPSNFSAKSELHNGIDILRAFPEEWLSAHLAADVSTEFLRVTTDHETYAAAQLVSCVESDTVPFTSATEAELRKLVASLSHIIAKALSPTSCYLALYDWRDYESSSAPPPGSSDTDTESTTAQLNVWDVANGYDFGFL